MQKIVHFFQDFERMSADQELYKDEVTTAGNKERKERMKKLLLVGMDHLLTNRQRFCIKSYYLYQKSVKEIAQELNITVWTVYKHLKSGMKALRQCAAYM